MMICYKFPNLAICQIANNSLFKHTFQVKSYLYYLISKLYFKIKFKMTTNSSAKWLFHSRENFFLLKLPQGKDFKYISFAFLVFLNGSFCIRQLNSISFVVLSIKLKCTLSNYLCEKSKVLFNHTIYSLEIISFKEN